MINKNELNKNCLIRFSKDELLVLFNWLSKLNEREHDGLDEITKKLLFDFECILESILEEPFMKDYLVKLEGAKNRIIRD